MLGPHSANSLLIVTERIEQLKYLYYIFPIGVTRKLEPQIAKLLLDIVPSCRSLHGLCKVVLIQQS